MSTGGGPDGRPPADVGPTAADESPGRAGDGERAGSALAYPLAGGAAAAVLCVIVLAAVDPSPGRHVRGLLILLALVGLLTVAWGWVRTVWYGPEPDHEPTGSGDHDAGRDDQPAGDAEHVE